MTEAEEIKKRWQEHTEELYKKDLYDPGNHEGTITYSVPLQGQQGYRGRIPVSPGGSCLVLSGSKGLHYPLESRRVTLGYRPGI